MSNAIALRPSYWASVSGGKDSLYMLNLILHNLDRYPLDGVVHYELEIDYPFIKNVIDYMESECKKHGIRFVRIKPRRTWEEWYYNISAQTGKMYGFPTRVARWCNDKYKLDASRRLDEWLEQHAYYRITYIGYCANEVKRVKRGTKREVYPLVDFGINEDVILDWAREQSIFNNYYKSNARCGCMYCPLASRISMAYLLKYYPEHYEYMIERMRESEALRSQEYGRPFAVMSGNPKYNADYIDNIVRTKWLRILNEREKQ